MRILDKEDNNKRVNLFIIFLSFIFFLLIARLYFLQIVKGEEYDKIIYAYESSDSSFKIKDIVNNSDKKILCIVGPEGGFSLEEVNFLKNCGAIEVSLGKRILRAETAAIVLSGMIINLI